MLLFLFELSATMLPKWVWYIGGVYLVCGLILNFASRRILLIRYFQFIGALLITLASSTLIWSLFRQGSTTSQLLIIVAALLLLLGGSLASGYEQVRRQGADFGYGYAGSLNPRTGILKPEQVPPSRKTEIDNFQNKVSNWRRISPIVAGLSMFFVNILSSDGVKIFISIAVVLLLWLGAFGLGRMFYFTRWVIQWEKTHREKILLGH